MSECRKCEYKDLCRELPKDLSCDDVKRISNCGAEYERDKAERKDDGTTVD